MFQRTKVDKKIHACIKASTKATIINALLKIQRKLKLNNKQTSSYDAQPNFIQL